MGLFEFLMVLVSVVIGIGVAEVLTGWAGMLRERETIRFYWVALLLQVGLFLALMQLWWEFWDFAHIEQLTFLGVLALIANPVFLFLLTHLAFPREFRGVDFEEYYFQQSALLWWLVIGGTLAGTFLEPLVLGYAVFQPENLSGIPLMAICVVLARSKSRRVHGILSPIILLLVVLDTILSNPAITAN